MADTGHFESFAKKYIPPIDTFMVKFFDERIEGLEFPFAREFYQDLKEYCTRPGKRIRPLVMIASFLGYKVSANDSVAEEDAVKLGAVIEMMHAMLLLQDDIIDSSDTRRGGRALHLILEDRYQPHSHNTKIGRDIAIVLGDILFADSIDIINETSLPGEIKKSFISVFSQTYQITAWGQILDILNTGTRKINVKSDEPDMVATMKTAYYTIYFPMLMGYILAAGESESEKKLIREFSLPLGHAFQIRDDILGVFGREDITGKSSDSDILEGKLTFLIQTTINSLNDDDQRRFTSLFSSNSKTIEDVAAIRSAIESAGAKETAMAKHRELVVEAGAKLEFLSISEAYKEVFNGLIKRISAI